MSQSLTHLKVHLIFSTKNRLPFLQDTIRGALHRYLATVLKNRACPPILINSVADHVHLLFGLSRTIPIGTAVGEVKQSSSKWLKTQGAEFADFSWQAGYGAFSVSESNVAAVKEYIADQQEHHRRKSFQDEYLGLLRRHGVVYDERYLWD